MNNEYRITNDEVGLFDIRRSIFDIRYPPIHPGEILKEEFLDPMGLSQREFAGTIHVPPNRVNEIIRGKRSISGDTAIRFSLALGTSPEMWLHLQARYELEKAMNESDPDLRDKIKPIE